MATYRLEAKVISRAKGRSATASAAYRAGTAIEDERTGLVFDYSRKRGVLHSAIMAPANTPEWMLDRAALWNAVERVEQRRDAQLARDFILSLPHELTHEQRVALVCDFLAEEFTSRGMIADFSIHAPDRRSDERNHHAHVMVTMRELTGTGFGLKNRDWNRTELLEEWREHWADKVNHHLERHGHEARVDHRSLEDQGIDREPEPKLGPVATEMERNGKTSHAGVDRRSAQARNGEREALSRDAERINAKLSGLYAGPRRRLYVVLADDGSKRRNRGQRGGASYQDSDGGMVAQQAAAMRRFRRNSEALKERRRQAHIAALPLAPLDGAEKSHKLYEGKDDLPSMSSMYRQMRSDQSKESTASEPAPEQRPEPPESQTPQPEHSQSQQSRSANLNWPADQSMAAQNAAANNWAKAGHAHRQEQAREAPEPEAEQQTPPEQAQGDKEPERKLRFAADREGASHERADLKREQSAAAPSKDEQTKDQGSDQKLNFARDRGQGPELSR